MGRPGSLLMRKMLKDFGPDKLEYLMNWKIFILTEIPDVEIIFTNAKKQENFTLHKHTGVNLWNVDVIWDESIELEEI